MKTWNLDKDQFCCDCYNSYCHENYYYTIVLYYAMAQGNEDFDEDVTQRIRTGLSEMEAGQKVSLR